MRFVEPGLVLAITLVLAVGFGYPTLWLVVPFVLITVRGRPYEEYGLSWTNPGSVWFHSFVVGIVWGGFVVVYSLFARFFLGQHFAFQLPPEFSRMVVEQILVIGLSEEFFFRGYLQTELNRSFGRPHRLFGASWGPGLIIAAVVFGLCHLVRGNPAQLQVILPGLFFGWLRERTGTITVPAIYHGLSNCLLFVLQASFRS